MCTAPRTRSPALRLTGPRRTVVLRLRAEHAVHGMRHRRAGGPVGERIAAILVAARMEIRILRSLPPAAAFEPQLVAAHAVEQRKAESLLCCVRAPQRAPEAARHLSRRAALYSTPPGRNPPQLYRADRSLRRSATINGTKALAIPDSARNHAPAAGAGNLILIDARLSPRLSRYRRTRHGNTLHGPAGNHRLVS